MNKILILAEKPSAALDISKAIGTFEYENEYFENKQYILVSSFGHLLSLTAPNDPVKGKWNLSRLPVIPDEFELGVVNNRAHERLKLLIKLINRKDVESIINACDAGREGELIFRYLIQFSKTAKPIKRLWLQSMTKQSIVNAFSNLRSDEQLKNLEAAARSRAEADWLIGINGTRAMTAFNSKAGGFFKTPVGRVQTPTLAIVFEREKQIRDFFPRNYWEVHAQFKVQDNFYIGKWFDPNFKRNESQPEKRDSRLWSRKSAEQICLLCKGKTASVTEEVKKSSRLPPMLYDLTSLQRDANNLLGFSAQYTLNIIQNLYEKHKATTYPRTDSKYLPEDFSDIVLNTIQNFSSKNSKSTYISSLITHSNKILKNNWVDIKNQRIFNDKKISDHFAIMPTLHIPMDLNGSELKLYQLITKRFLSVFFPAAQYQLKTRLSEISNNFFKTEEKILLISGWLEVYGTEITLPNSEKNIIQISENERVYVDNIKISDLITKPPVHYSEATLLSAMEGAGKFVEDEDLREAMKERGLGTPATRSTIIEGLLNENYLYRNSNNLITTAKAHQLMTLLKGLGIKELVSPELTGEWEFKLKKMEKNALDRPSFMKEIVQMTRIIVEKAKLYELDTIPGDYATIKNNCPKCGATVRENYKRYACTHCNFSLIKHPAKRTLTLEEVEQLLKNSKVGPLNGFLSKTGKPFSAILRIDDEYKLVFDFGKNEPSNSIIDPSKQTSLGICPKCSSNVFEYDMNYACEKAVGVEKNCTFRFRKIILQQEIPKEQIKKFLKNGRTDLLDGFVSNRTNRKFKVFLICKNDGNIGFEFEKNRVKTTTGSKSKKKKTLSDNPKN